MTESPIPAGITLKTETIPYQRVHTAFENSRHGQKLGSAVRFDRYREKAGMSPDAWVDLLGRDVNNREHLVLTDQLVTGFLRSCRDARIQGDVADAAVFTPAEEGRIRLTGWIHDWAEAVKGHEDKTYGDKTDDDERREHAALNRMVREKAHAATTTREDADVLTREMRSVLKEVLGDRTTKEGQAFHAIEAVGYTRTAVRTWEFAQLPQHAGKKDGLSWLTADVLSHQTGKLLRYAEVYPPVREFLNIHKHTITHAFDAISDTTFDNYKTQDQQKMRDKYMQAKGEWFGAFPKPQEEVVFTA